MLVFIGPSPFTALLPDITFPIPVPSVDIQTAAPDNNEYSSITSPYLVTHYLHYRGTTYNEGKRSVDTDIHDAIWAPRTDCIHMNGLWQSVVRTNIGRRCSEAAQSESADVCIDTEGRYVYDSFDTSLVCVCDRQMVMGM